MRKAKKNPKIAGVTMEGEQIDPKLKDEWESRLVSEGMPEELPPALLEIVDSSHSAVSAARALEALRQHGAALSFNEGVHHLFISALGDKFGISESEAQELLDDTVHYQQQEFLERGAWVGK